MKKVNLFIVGAPRCGTTSLHTYLHQHPDIYMSEEKEPLRFCKDLHADSDQFHGSAKFYNQYRTDANFAKIFSGVKDEQYRGESSTPYLYSTTAAQEIYDHNPDAKIIAILRNPVDFIYSLHSIYISSFNEDEKSFEKALALQADRAQGKSLPKMVTFPSRLQYVAMAQFTEQVKRYQALFPAQNIKIILFDDLMNDTPQVYRDTLDFLGIDPTFNANLAAVNSAKVARFEGISKAIKSTPLYDTYLKMPIGFRSKVEKSIQSVYFKKQKREKMSDELRTKLKAELKPEVERMSDLFGMDLVKRWGY